jgi:hypothetical protein
VIRFALPALLFKSLAQRSFEQVLNLRYLAAYAVGSLVVLGLGLLWAMKVRRQGLEAGAITAMGMSCANSGYIGYPIALQVVGASATIALALTMIVENLLMIPLCLALADSGSSRHERFRAAFGRALAALPRNPIVMAIVVGIGCALAQVALPMPAMQAVDMLAAASAPAALFFIGGSLVGLRVDGLITELAGVAAGKLVLHPLAVAGALIAFGPVAPELRSAAVMMACAPMMGIYPILGHQHGQQAVCAARMLVATLLSFVTIGLALGVLHAIGWAPHTR